MITVGTLFSGGGLADVGYQAAGGELLWAIEHDAAIADVYRANLGNHIIIASVLDVDPATLPSVDLLHASPPCQAHSQARSKALGARDDADVGLDVLRYVAVLLPRCVVIENVIPYRHSASCQALTAGLMQLGYMVDCQNINAADYGVAQTRNRLIIRAVRDGWVPELIPTHGTKAQPWIGWYAAIEDLIPTLPESAFAPWQLARLPNELTASAIFNNQASDDHHGGTYGITARIADEPSVAVTNSYVPKAFLVDGQTCDNGTSLTISPDGEPTYTVSASAPHRPARAFLHMTGNTNIAQPTGTGILEPEAPANTVVSNSTAARAFLMRSQNAGQEWSEPTRDADTPAMTIPQGEKPKAFVINGIDGRRRDKDDPSMTITASEHQVPTRAWLDQGRVVSMTPRALARFQSVPDWYVLPAKASLACKVIGNGVACLLAQRIAESLIPCMELVEVA